MTVSVAPGCDRARIARYIDAKADVARRYAKHRHQERETWDHVARVLDATADEVRLGLEDSDAVIS